MTDRRTQLFREEDARWAELAAALATIPADRMLEPGVTPEWSVKDLLAHLAGWMAQAVDVLEQIRAGSYVRERLDIDAMNARFVDACVDSDLSIVRAELSASHTRMLQEMDTLPEVTPEAVEWFTECGAVHYEEHLPQLRRFADGL